jgi:hypothetical protein
LPEGLTNAKIKPNIYADPSEAIAPNGRYLISFKISKVLDRLNEQDDNKNDDNIFLDSQRIKKDALYKPLLRKFRAFLRKVFDGLGLSKGCHYWARDKMIQQVMTFATKINLPMNLRTSRNYAILTVILFPSTMKKRQEEQNSYSEISCYFSQIKDVSYEIFKENNIQKRLKFFSTPLIQSLWTFMIRMKPELVFNHLRRARSFPYKGECRFQSLFRDMQDLEQQMDFHIIPSMARNPKNITIFSMREVYEDMKQNAKYKNRNHDAIQRSLDKIRAMQTIRNQIALQKMGVSSDEVRKLMQGENGLSGARLAKTNKEIGHGSELEESESEEIDVEAMFKRAGIVDSQQI